MAPRALLLACAVVEPDLLARTRPDRRVARRDPDLLFDDAADAASESDETSERATFEQIAVEQTARVLADYRRLVMPASRAADRGFVDAVRARYALSTPLRRSLAAVPGPVDLVCGRDDHWVGYQDAARLVGVPPRGSLHVIEGAGQLLPIEAPERFASFVDGWLARIERMDDDAR